MKAARHTLRPLPEISVPLTPKLAQAFATVGVEPDEWPRLDALHDDPTLDWTGFYQDITRIADQDATRNRAKWDSDWLLTLVAVGLGILRGEARCGGPDLYVAKLVDVARTMALPDPFQIARDAHRLLFTGLEALREINVRRDRHVGVRFVQSRDFVEHALIARRIVLDKLSQDFTSLIVRREAPGARNKSTDDKILDQVVDVEILDTTARRLDKAGLGPRAALVRALDGRLNYLPRAVVDDLVDRARHERQRERWHLLTADDDDTIPMPDEPEHDEIDVENRAILDWLGQAKHPKVRAFADAWTRGRFPTTLEEAAARVGLSRQRLTQILKELRGEKRRRRMKTGSVSV